MGGIMKVEVLVTISYLMIQHYFFNALKNPQTLSLFGRVLESLYWRAFFFVACSILLLFVWYSVYLLIKKHFLASRRKNLTLSELKNSFLLSYEKRKGSFSKSRYLILWAVLQLLSWNFVGFIFDAMSQGLETSNTNEHFAINMLLGKWASFSLLIFMIAPYFITFSFGNKLVRNLGILTYIFWIWFLFFGFFLQFGTF